MNEDKQIEEMAKVIYASDVLCHTCGESTYTYCADAIAERLYNAGYRKASEIFEEIEKYLVTGCTFYGQAIHSIGVGTFAELKKKYTESEKDK